MREFLPEVRLPLFAFVTVTKEIWNEKHKL